MPNKIIVCIDCKNEFVLTEGEQAFYESKEFTEPKRCKECRLKKKQVSNDRNNNIS